MEEIEYDEALANLFAYHPPLTEATKARHEDVRNLLNETAQVLNNWLPASREKSIALTKIQEAMWAANAAVAIHQKKEEE